MELNHLRTFFEVAKAGSFTAAARSLRISQSALSKTVALLEAREGVQLLRRSKSGVTLTPIGTRVFEEAEQIFTRVATLQGTIRGHKETCEGILPLAASDHIANYLLAPSAAKLRQRFPKLVPSIFSGTPMEAAELIQKDKIEFGLSFLKLNRPWLAFEPARSVEMAIVCSPSLVPGGKIKGKSDLLKQLSYISSIRSNPNVHPSPELLEVMGEDPTVAFESSSQETQKRLCLAGVGFAYLARFMVEKEIERKELLEFPLPEAPKLTIYVARKKGVPLSLNARTFLKEAGMDGRGK
jgi:DNA-binding transcriptional LysR family regulator